jgi:exonuclease III
VIGGDFNISRTFSSKHKAYFDRLRESGVHDCCCKDGKEAQSFWGHQSRARTYQDDHFFSSESIAGRVTSCCVMDNPRTRILSDHGPVVLDFE